MVEHRLYNEDASLAQAYCHAVETRVSSVAIRRVSCIAIGLGSVWKHLLETLNLAENTNTCWEHEHLLGTRTLAGNTDTCLKH